MGLKLFICAALCSLFAARSFADMDSVQYSRNSLYLEVGGVGGYGSVNFERVIYDWKNLTFAIRAGASAYHLRDYTNRINPSLVFPVAVNVHFGKNHKIELGAGLSLTSIVYGDLSEQRKERREDLHSHLNFGYRYQRKTKGLFFRCGYTPIFELNKSLKHWAGVSIGYSF